MPTKEDIEEALRKEQALLANGNEQSESNSKTKGKKKEKAGLTKIIMKI